MRPLSPAGQQAIQDLAQRHGFSPDAVRCMLEAVLHGHGSMAQFNHPEFGGSGQWMPGGMTMLSDMFNHTLKGRVEGLCDDLAHLVAHPPDLMHGGSFQSQSQGDGQGQQPGGYGSNPPQTAAAASNRTARGRSDRSACSCRPRPAHPATGGARTCAGRPAPAPRTACATPTSLRPGGWRSRSAAGSRSTTRSITRSAVFRSSKARAGR